MQGVRGDGGGIYRLKEIEETLTNPTHGCNLDPDSNKLCKIYVTIWDNLDTDW